MRESYFWHKVHSITGVLPVGYYMVQHLVLNSFSIAGPDKFNAVIEFFDGIPPYLLLCLEVGMIWLPLLFHAVYGVFIVERAKPNFMRTPYKWDHNLMYSLQRYTGLFLFVFLIYHSLENTGAKYLKHDSTVVKFAAWQEQLTSHHYLWLVFYMAGVLAACYHLCYGLWGFCIRWGITISEAAQRRVQRFSLAAFVALTIVGWGALIGFVIPRGGATEATDKVPAMAQPHNSSLSRPA